MKKKLFYLFLCVSNIVLCQNTYEDIVKPRLSFVSDKEMSSDTSQIVVLNNNDTLYSKINPDYDLSFLNQSNYTEKYIISYYTEMVFRYTNAKSKVPFEIKQWNTPIIIFMDKRLPKNVVEKFEEFYAQIKDIPNLNISFTNKLEDANYHIKITTEEINGYQKDYKFDSEDDRINSPLTGGTYLLQTDKNNKFFTGVLTINIDDKNDFQILKQLKQLFFISLGQFAQGYRVENSNVSNKNYDNSDTIGTFDLEILKIHYALIYDQKINGSTFKELIKLSKQIQ